MVAKKIKKTFSFSIDNPGSSAIVRGVTNNPLFILGGDYIKNQKKKLRKLEQKVKELEEIVEQLEKRTDDSATYKAACWILAILEITVAVITIISSILN